MEVCKSENERVIWSRWNGNYCRELREKYKITRKDQDLFMYYSQMKAKKQSDGRFEEEIVSVEITQRKKEPIIFSKDEFIKSNTSLEILSKLRTAFKKRRR